MSEPAISFEGVTKRFRRWHASVPHTTLKSMVVRMWDPRARAPEPRWELLSELDLALEVGETLGVVGRNGAGKSTLLRLIAGIYRPDVGRITVRGRVAPLLELGAGFHAEFTARENILVNGVLLGLTRAQVRDRAEAILDFAELAAHSDAPLRTWSTGMVMRLGFSIAIHVEPDILLVDEALAVGDARFQERSREALTRRVRERRGTTVIVSHDTQAIRTLCGPVLVLDPPHARLHPDAESGLADHARALEALP